MEKNNMKLQFAPICTTKTLISHIDTDMIHGTRRMKINEEGSKI